MSMILKNSSCKSRTVYTIFSAENLDVNILDVIIELLEVFFLLESGFHWVTTSFPAARCAWVEILLMEEILHHLGCKKPGK